MHGSRIRAGQVHVTITCQIKKSGEQMKYKQTIQRGSLGSIFAKGGEQPEQDSRAHDDIIAMKKQ